MKIMNWSKFNESNESNESNDFELKVTTIFVGVEEYIPIDDFSMDDYIEYKKTNTLPLDKENEFKELTINDLGLEYTIEDNSLNVSTNYIGTEINVELDADVEYNDDELFELAYIEMGVDFEIVPANDYTEKKYNDIIKKNKYKI